MSQDLKKSMEEWEHLQKVKHTERRWVETMCDNYIFAAESLGDTVTLDELFGSVMKSLQSYPDEEFYMTDAEISRICEGFLEDDAEIEKMSQVD